MKYLFSMSLWITGALFLMLMLPLSFILWFIVWPFDEKRIVFHRWLTFQAVAVTFLVPVRKIKIEGSEKINKKQTYVIISNHQSVLDILVLYRLWMNFKWISKIENLKVPVLGWYLRMAKYIPVDRGNSQSKSVMMTESVEMLNKGISILIFPEGTRSAAGETKPFKKGAFEMALMTDKPVLPVAVEGTGKVLSRHARIFRPVNRIVIRVLDPVFPGSFGTSNPEELAVKFRGIISEELEKIRRATQ